MTVKGGHIHRSKMSSRERALRSQLKQIIGPQAIIRGTLLYRERSPYINKGQKVFYDVLEKWPQKLEPNTKPKSRTIHRPAPDHPWRKCFMATKELKEATV